MVYKLLIKVCDLQRLVVFHPFVNHGKAALTLEANLETASDELKKLSALGINLDSVCAQLLDDGIKSFNKAFESLMSAIENKAKN